MTKKSLPQDNTLCNLVPTRHVDIAVIGAGTAGQKAFKQALSATKNCVIINSGYWTTTCATVGCMPSKLLIAAAERAYHAYASQAFGINAEVAIDGKAVMRRVQAERDRFAGFVQTQVDDWQDCQKIEGQAKIMGKTAAETILIAVNDEIIACQQLIIATGAKPVVPEAWQDSLGDRLLTSDNVFELSDLPKSLAVIGAGAIGLELAQAMAKLGVSVRLFNRSDKVAGLHDSKVNTAAIDGLTHTRRDSSAKTRPPFNLTLALNSNIIAVKKLAEHGGNTDHPSVHIDYTDADDQPQTFVAEYVLVAMGRNPHLDNLGITKLGVVLNEQGRPQDLHPITGQIADLPLYVVGDANSVLPLMHVASHEGIWAGFSVHDNVTKTANSNTKATPNTMTKTTTGKKNLTKSPLRAVDKNSFIAHDLPVMLGIVFCDPQIAQVGQTLDRLQQRKKTEKFDFVIGEVSFADQGRSRVMDENQGLLRIYADKATGEMLGASMVAPDAEYLAHLLALAITHHMTLADMLAMPFYHPTVVEGLRTALNHAQRQLAG